MNVSEREEQSQPWTLSLTCGCPLIERQAAKQQLESSLSSQNILWDKLQKVFITCLQSNSSIAKQEIVVFFERLWYSKQVDSQTLAEQLLNGIEKCSDKLTEKPLELFGLLIKLLFALQCETTRNFYLVRLLSNPYLEDIAFYALCEFFMIGRQEEKVTNLQILVSPLSTLVSDNKDYIQEKVFYFLSTIHDYMDESNSKERKESLFNIILQLLAIKKSLSLSELGLVHKLWSSSSQDISQRAVILHYLLAQSFEEKSEFLLSVWSSTKDNMKERKLWQQTISYYFGRNHWISIIMWLVFIVIRMGKISAAFELKQLLDLVFSAETEMFTSNNTFIEILLIIMEHEHPNISWISSLRETWNSCKLVNTTSQEPMTRHLYGVSSTRKLEIFGHFPNWVISIHMLEDFLQGERMDELLWKWYNNLKHSAAKTTLQLWFAICCAHIWKQIHHVERLSQAIHLFHEANSIEKLTFLPIVFHSGWFVQFGKLSMIWLQSWLTSCPIDSYYSLVIYKWMCSLVRSCKKHLNQSIRIYTLIISVMLKESVTRGDPWKTTVVEEICYCVESSPSDSHLQRIAYKWIEFLVQERPTWVAYSMLSIVQQPLASNSTIPDIAASCIRIVCELCQAKLLDFRKTFRTLYKWCYHLISSSREMELAWIQLLHTVLILSSEKDSTDTFHKYLMESNAYLEIFEWISCKFVDFDIHDNYFRNVMDTWLLWLKECLFIRSITTETIGGVLEPTRWNSFLEKLFEKYFSKECHLWFAESEDTLHHLVEVMIQVAELEWQYRKRLEWSAIERDHSVRKWSFTSPSAQVWLTQLETYILQCPYGIIRCCLNNIFILLNQLLVHEEDKSGNMSQGFYSLWILSYSQIIPFQKLFWQKWLVILNQYWLSWMEPCVKLGWKHSTFMFWISFWSRWSIQVSSTCKEWLISTLLENGRDEKLEDWLEMSQFYILWDMLVGYRPMKVQPSLLLSPESTISSEGIHQSVENWWKYLFHIMETRLNTVEYLYCLFRFGDWAELALLYQRRTTLDNTVDYIMKDWIRRKIMDLFQHDVLPCDRFFIPLMKMLEPWKSLEFDDSNVSENRMSVINIRYYCMKSGLCDWKTAFGIEFLQSWMMHRNDALLNNKKLYQDCSLRYDPLEGKKNLEQMVQTCVECLSNAQDKYGLLEFLYNAWIETYDAKLNKNSCRDGFEDSLVELLGWYLILFSNQNVHSIPVENVKSIFISLRDLQHEGFSNTILGKLGTDTDLLYNISK